VLEHRLGMKPWDLERLDTYGVIQRLEYVQELTRQIGAIGGE
jgi:hypothetical protein